MSSPQMLAEQGGSQGLLSDWGGGSQYEQVAQLPMEHRMVFYASQQPGLGDVASIAIATGLSEKTVQAAANRLAAEGIISPSAITPISGVEAA